MAGELEMYCQVLTKPNIARNSADTIRRLRDVDLLSLKLLQSKLSPSSCEFFTEQFH